MKKWYCKRRLKWAIKNLERQTSRLRPKWENATAIGRRLAELGAPLDVAAWYAVKELPGYYPPVRMEELAEKARKLMVELAVKPWDKNRIGAC